jgi:hypothetical protein
MSEHLFSRDEEPYRYQMTFGDGAEADELAEKELDLPARSALAKAGRNISSISFERFQCMQNLIFNDYHGYP